MCRDISTRRVQTFKKPKKEEKETEETNGV